ncbi:hypothetical protein Pcinc_025882 [Petrolisthes cinctipes]|uniref:Ribosomal RNA-processing protein 43 n=1 Tax=Petrolisthes cinctipes TaxID=88211 RepID=A0AAE1BWS9_PETCI|nr:hypothetical protein Pcinc_037315 [Petrolisthes cinctipes]KAK3868752.1 hypothetical protein Pcinc_025882 [Petrolisthes cinctipes]
MTTLEVWKTFEPDNYYKTFLDSNKRPDGRRLLKFRPVVVKVGTVSTAEGSATVRFGHTTVVCGVKAEIATPTLNNPHQGFVVPNVELHPCCSPNFTSGLPGVQAMELSQFIQSVLTSAGVLDLADLCVVPSKYSWCLYCDVVCINYDGNVYDAALVAVMAALQDVKLPKLTYDEENDKATVALERTLPLNIKSRPISSTFTLYSDTVQLADPTAEDESQGSGVTTVVVREDGSLCYLHKPGGRAVPTTTLDSLVLLAAKRVKKINEVIAKAGQEVD